VMEIFFLQYLNSFYQYELEFSDLDQK